MTTVIGSMLMAQT